MAGDIAEGAKGVVIFFAIAIAFTFIMVWLFCGSLKLTILPIMCSNHCCNLAIRATVEFRLWLRYPMSILVPFLVFAIGVSHGVQMINAIGKKVGEGKSTRECCQSSFRALLNPRRHCVVIGYGWLFNSANH